MTLDERLSEAQLKLRDDFNDDLSAAIAEARNLINELKQNYAKAGATKSEAKSNAARENGRKGGRPRIIK